MKQLLGEYTCKIDAKGRMRLPSALLGQLGGSKKLSFVVNRGIEKCLVLFPEEVWEVESEKVNQLNPYDEKSRIFMRFFYRGATKVEMDGSDRILIPKLLLDWGEIDKEVILSTVNDRVEIWSKDKYDVQLSHEPEDFSALAQAVLGNKKDSE